MKRSVSVRIAIFLLLCIQACKNEEIKPEGPPETELKASLSHPVSYYRLPVYYPVQRFEDWINGKISGKFIDHGFRVGSDSLYLEAEKPSPIRMRLQRERLVYAIPVTLKGNYFKNVLGLKIGHRQPIETSLILHASSAVDLDKQWNIVSKTRIDRIEWKEDPVLRIGPLRIHLKKHLEGMLEKKEAELLGKVDSAVYEHIDLREAIAKVWGDIQKPMAISKEEPKVWFKIHSKEVYGDLDLTDPEHFAFEVLVAAHTSVGLDSTELASITKLPDMAGRAAPRDSLTLEVFGQIPFATANQLLEAHIDNMKFEGYGMELQIKQARMYGTDNGVAIRLDVSGSVDGRLYLTGVPEYSPETKELRVAQLRYDVATQSYLVSAANAAFYETVRQSLEQALVLYLGDEINYLPELISGAIEKGKSAERLDLNIDHIDIGEWNFLITQKGIQFVLSAGAQANIEIEKLKIKKQIFVGER